MGFTSTVDQDDTINSLDRVDIPGILMDISTMDMDHVDMN